MMTSVILKKMFFYDPFYPKTLKSQTCFRFPNRAGKMASYCMESSGIQDCYECQDDELMWKIFLTHCHALKPQLLSLI